MKLRKRHFILIFYTILFIVSCKSYYKPQVYRYQDTIENYRNDEVERVVYPNDKTTIVLKNDSILEYRKVYGGLASITTVKYTLNKCQLIVDSIDIYGYINPEISNSIFIYNKDSLVNTELYKKYYNEKYFKLKKK